MHRYLTGAEAVLQQSDTEAYLWARRAANRGLPRGELCVFFRFCDLVAFAYTPTALWAVRCFLRTLSRLRTAEGCAQTMRKRASDASATSKRRNDGTCERRHRATNERCSVSPSSRSRTTPVCRRSQLDNRLRCVRSLRLTSSGLIIAHRLNVSSHSSCTLTHSHCFMHSLVDTPCDERPTNRAPLEVFPWSTTTASAAEQFRHEDWRSMNFFSSKSRVKSPADLVKSLRDAVSKLDVGQAGSESRRKVSSSSALL